MKVAELRKVIEKYNIKELGFIVAEMYKAFPKKMLDEKEIDYIIENPRKDKKDKKDKKKILPLPDMDELFDEVSFFCSDAMDQLYFRPNREISKKERSGWRFKVIKMYKNLLLAGTVEENAEQVAISLAELYKVMCHGCGFHIFSSTRTFATIKVPHFKFLEETLKFNNIYLSGVEAAKFNIEIILNNDLDFDILTSELVDVALDYFKTDKQMGFGITSLNNLITKTKKLKLREYEAESKIKKMAIFGFKIYISNYENQKAIDFFKKYYKHPDKEIELYILIKLLKEFEEYALIVQEYELALKNKIKPRGQLEVIYNTSLNVSKG